MSVSAARNALTQLLAQLGERVAIVKGGKPVAVLLSFDDFRVLRATQALLRQPELVTRMYQSREMLEKGKADQFRKAEEAFEERSNRIKHAGDDRRLDHQDVQEEDHLRGESKGVRRRVAKPEELRDLLLQTDEEFRQLATKHQELDVRLHELSEAEQLEETTLKKRKLQLKDRMEDILRRHRSGRHVAPAARRAGD